MIENLRGGSSNDRKNIRQILLVNYVMYYSDNRSKQMFHEDNFDYDYKIKNPLLDTETHIELEPNKPISNLDGLY